MKKLVIINGVTGAIGSACLSLFASQKNTVVYGISRQARDFTEFCLEGKLPVATLICSLLKEMELWKAVDFFAKAIPADVFDEIYYIHAVGLYPFEIDSKGKRIVKYDYNKDGVDDRCEYLTFQMFRAFHHQISMRIKNKPLRSFLFGSLADKHKPLAHTSWWKTLNKLRQLSEFGPDLQGNISLLNISSVLCPNELITRPFVFISTDADSSYWLLPSEVATYVDRLIRFHKPKVFFEDYELFKKKPKFNQDTYYQDEFFTPRKIAELFKKD